MGSDAPIQLSVSTRIASECFLDTLFPITLTCRELHQAVFLAPKGISLYQTTNTVWLKCTVVWFHYSTAAVSFINVVKST